MSERVRTKERRSERLEEIQLHWSITMRRFERDMSGLHERRENVKQCLLARDGPHEILRPIINQYAST